MSTQISCEPTFVIMNKAQTHFVTRCHKRNGYDETSVELSVTPVSDINSLNSAIKSQKVTTLARSLHDLDVARKTNTLRWYGEILQQDASEFIISKLSASIELTPIDENEIIAEIDAERLEQQAARQERINALLAKLDASKLTDGHVANIEDILCGVN